MVVTCLALAAALANAVASICQRLGVEDAPANDGPTLGLVRHMVRRPVWVAGFAIMALGFVAQAVALHLGSLDVVQPLLVSELVMVVLALWLWFATPLRARDLLAVGATTLGLAAFLALATPSESAVSPSNARWLAVTAVVLFVATSLVLLAMRGPAWWRALLRGAGAAVGFALVAALTKSLTNVLVTDWGALLTTWQLYALCAVGLASFLVMQSAFQVGPFAASQSSLILLNPLVSLVIGHVLFDESLRGGTLRTVFEILSVALLVAGAVGLSASPLIATVHDESGGSQLLRGRGRFSRSRRR